MPAWWPTRASDDLAADDSIFGPGYGLALARGAELGSSHAASAVEEYDAAVAPRTEAATPKLTREERTAQAREWLEGISEERRAEVAWALHHGHLPSDSEGNVQELS